MTLIKVFIAVFYVITTISQIINYASCSASLTTPLSSDVISNITTSFSDDIAVIVNETTKVVLSDITKSLIESSTAINSLRTSITPTKSMQATSFSSTKFIVSTEKTALANNVTTIKQANPPLATPVVEADEMGVITPPPSVDMEVNFLKQLDELDDYMINITEVTQ